MTLFLVAVLMVVMGEDFRRYVCGHFRDFFF